MVFGVLENSSPVSRIDPGRFLIIMVDEIHFSVVIGTVIPTGGQWHFSTFFTRHNSLKSMRRNGAAAVTTIRNERTNDARRPIHYFAILEMDATTTRSGSKTRANANAATPVRGVRTRRDYRPTTENEPGARARRAGRPQRDETRGEPSGRSGTRRAPRAVRSLREREKRDDAAARRAGGGRDAADIDGFPPITKRIPTPMECGYLAFMKREIDTVRVVFFSFSFFYAHDTTDGRYARCQRAVPDPVAAAVPQPILAGRRGSSAIDSRGRVCARTPPKPAISSNYFIKIIYRFLGPIGQDFAL